MSKKRYTIKSSCPKCGCTGLTVLSDEEIKAKYGDLPNIDLECSECLLKYRTDLKTACPEWDHDCKFHQS